MGFWGAGSEWRVASGRLQVAGCKLQVASWTLVVSQSLSLSVSQSQSPNLPLPASPSLDRVKRTDRISLQAVPDTAYTLL